MALKAKNDDIPREPAEGNPPDSHPRFGHLLATAWSELSQEHYHQKSRTDVERYVRLGWAGQCARKIGYQLLEVPPSNPPDVAAEWRMGLGTMVHELLQEAVVRAFPDAEVEKVVGAEHDEMFGFPVSGRSDLYLVSQPFPDHVAIDPKSGRKLRGDGKPIDRRTLVEIKTINGFGFKMAVGARGAAEGPKTGALYQAGMNARAHGADEVVLVYLSLECLSDRELTGLVAKTGGEDDPIRKFVAEFSYTMAELDPLIDDEVRRLAKIVGMVEAYAAPEETVEDMTAAPLPPRSVPLEIPARARIVDPMKGTWQVTVNDNVMDAGTYWGCASYCSHRDRCVQDGPS